MSESENFPQALPSSPAPTDPGIAELDARITMLEGRVQHLEARLEDGGREQLARKQRALLWRIVLLGALLLGYFYLRFSR